MGFRFKKTVNVAPGVKLNVGKKSVGVSVGPKGAKISASTSGRKTVTAGIPGTGLSYMKSLNPGKSKDKKKAAKDPGFLAHIQDTLKQARETVDILNTTKKPDIFFGRLHFLFDILLYLIQYEDVIAFKGTVPSKQIAEIRGSMEDMVNAFIDRSYQAAAEKAAALKTEKGRQNAISRYITSMKAAFNGCDTYWQGNDLYPHYDGPLFTEGNVDYLDDLSNRIELEK